MENVRKLTDKLVNNNWNDDTCNIYTNNGLTRFIKNLFYIIY